MILVTGADGFIGSRLVQVLNQRNFVFRGLVRKLFSAHDHFVVGDLTDPVSLIGACRGIETIFHCAGYAHAVDTYDNSDADKHWMVNFQGTKNLVEMAGIAGVKRFIFLSTVKAMADVTEYCVDENFHCAPTTSYGRSKLAAEKIVLETGRRYEMHVVILRLSMVYGNGGRGNLERMAEMIRLNIFPPLPETGNHRSLVHVDDVVEAILLAAECPVANCNTYIVANKNAPSARELYDAIRIVLSKPPCRWTVPFCIFRIFGFVGDFFVRAFKRDFPLNSNVLDRLFCSAWFSPSKIERELGWRAKVTLNSGLSEMLDL